MSAFNLKLPLTIRDAGEAVIVEDASKTALAHKHGLAGQLVSALCRPQAEFRQE